ncbi:MAG: TlpA disulfide reductase family protein [Ramlibacter sp.]|jgi:thiol-disulfide isomerase/thioredoxin
MNESDSPSSSATGPADTARRRWLLGGAATAAGVTGAGVAWWKFQPHAVSPGAELALWGLSFDTPTGGTLALQALKGRPLLINFWATWCPPCVEEMPLLDRFFRENASKGWQVVGLAIDQPSAVRAFLQKTPVTFPIGLAGLSGTDLGKSLGNLTGALPFTVVIGSGGVVAQRKMGKVSADDLAQWMRLK